MAPSSRRCGLGDDGHDPVAGARRHTGHSRQSRARGNKHSGRRAAGRCECRWRLRNLRRPRRQPAATERQLVVRVQQLVSRVAQRAPARPLRIRYERTRLPFLRHEFVKHGSHRARFKQQSHLHAVIVPELLSAQRDDPCCRLAFDNEADVCFALQQRLHQAAAEVAEERPKATECGRHETAEFGLEGRGQRGELLPTSEGGDIAVDVFGSFADGASIVGRSVFQQSTLPSLLSQQHDADGGLNKRHERCSQIKSKLKLLAAYGQQDTQWITIGRVATSSCTTIDQNSRPPFFSCFSSEGSPLAQQIEETHVFPLSFTRHHRQSVGSGGRRSILFINAVTSASAWQ